MVRSGLNIVNDKLSQIDWTFSTKLYSQRSLYTEIAHLLILLIESFKSHLAAKTPLEYMFPCWLQHFHSLTLFHLLYIVERYIKLFLLVLLHPIDGWDRKLREKTVRLMLKERELPSKSISTYIFEDVYQKRGQHWFQKMGFKPGS